MKSRISIVGLCFVILMALVFALTIKIDVVLGDKIYTPTPIVSVTPHPSPDPDSRDLDLLPTFEAVSVADYGDCELPCWWGFKPGETILAEEIRSEKSFSWSCSWARLS